MRGSFNISFIYCRKVSKNIHVYEIQLHKIFRERETEREKGVFRAREKCKERTRLRTSIFERTSCFLILLSI